MDLAGRGANICVVCDNTDVVILMLHFYCGKNLNCGVIMESPVPGRKVVDIIVTTNKHKRHHRSSYRSTCTEQLWYIIFVWHWKSYSAENADARKDSAAIGNDRRKHG